MASSLDLWRAAIITSASNVALQYNYQSVAAVMLIWDKINGSVPDWAESSLSSSVYAGSIAGMVSLGYLGDLMGRQAGMTATLSLMTLGALGTAVLSWGKFDTTVTLVVFWRFVLGMGIGGVYPLSTATAFEAGDDAKAPRGTHGPSSPSEAVKTERGPSGIQSTTFPSPSTSYATVAATRRVRVAWNSFWQQPGQMLPYLYALLLLALFRQNHLALQWRLLLGCGALMPSALVADSFQNGGQRLLLTKTFPFVVLSSDSGSEAGGGEPMPGMFSQCFLLLSNPAINKKLVATMVCWFVYDVYAYGIVMYTPEILKIIFGDSDDVPCDYWQNVMCVAATFPAALLSIWVLGRYSTRTLQLWGFTGASFGFLLLATLWKTLEKHSKVGLFLVFLLQKNLTQFGCGSTCMVMPNELFPKKVRSSCNGLAAAAGKLGAFVGSFVFPYVYDDLSIQAVFYGCAIMAVIGFITTVALIPSQVVDPDAPENAGAAETAGKKDGEGREDVSETTALLSL